MIKNHRHLDLKNAIIITFVVIIIIIIKLKDCNNHQHHRRQHHCYCHHFIGHTSCRHHGNHLIIIIIIIITIVIIVSSSSSIPPPVFPSIIISPACLVQSPTVRHVTYRHHWSQGSSPLNPGGYLEISWQAIVAGILSHPASPSNSNLTGRHLAELTASHKYWHPIRTGLNSNTRQPRLTGLSSRGQPQLRITPN